MIVKIKIAFLKKQKGCTCLYNTLIERYTERKPPRQNEMPKQP